MKHKAPVKALVERASRNLRDAADEATRLHDDHAAAFCMSFALALKHYADSPSIFMIHVPRIFQTTFGPGRSETTITMRPIVEDDEDEFE